MYVCLHWGQQVSAGIRCPCRPPAGKFRGAKSGPEFAGHFWGTPCAAPRARTGEQTPQILVRIRRSPTPAAGRAATSPVESLQVKTELRQKILPRAKVGARRGGQGRLAGPTPRRPRGGPERTPSGALPRSRRRAGASTPGGGGGPGPLSEEGRGATRHYVPRRRDATAATDAGDGNGDGPGHGHGHGHGHGYGPRHGPRADDGNEPRGRRDGPGGGRAGGDGDRGPDDLHRPAALEGRALRVHERLRRVLHGPAGLPVPVRLQHLGGPRDGVRPGLRPPGVPVPRCDCD